MSVEHGPGARCLSDAEIMGWLRDELGPAAREQADQHFKECATCAAKVSPAQDTAQQTLDRGEASSLVDIELASKSGSHWTDGSIVGEFVTESAALPNLSLADFLNGLSQSGLLASGDLANVRVQSSKDPETGTVTGLIEWLIRESKLTRYQAEILARGQKAGLVLGNYVVLEKLGQGGMGTVFKARHRRMNRLVALKVLPNSLSSIPEAVARFQREVEAAARLHHPNIAAAYDADEAAGVHFLVMEYVEGPNLSSYVKAHGPLPVTTAVRLMEQAARGLVTAHAQGVVHRDIKPSNLMVNRDGVLKVLDMGLAQMRGGDSNLELTSDVTQTGRVMGTVDYMAPEQARDAKSVDARADIYSLACTLYFLATGKTLAPGSSAAEKLLWHQTQSPPPLSELCPHATPRLDGILQQMMARKPDERTASMQIVADELLECLAELPPEEEGGLLVAASGVAEQDSKVSGGRRSAQATRMGGHGDTIVSHGQTIVQTLPGSRRGSRWVVAACGIVGAAALAIVLAAPYFSARPSALEEALVLVDVEGGPADVLVNSLLRGRAGEEGGKSLEIKLKPGQYFVQVRRDGFEPYETQVVAQAKTPTRIAATLRRIERLPVPVHPTSPHLPYENLLSWVFRNHGQVIATSGSGVQHHFASLTALPSEPLVILGVKLDGTGVSDGELSLLAAAPGLRNLSLADTKITDEGLMHVAALRQLTHLNLSKTQVTSAGLAHLGRLAELTELNLERTAISDSGLTRLAALPKLERLFLSDTQVTDVGLLQLKSLAPLRSLALYGTGLSEAGHTALKAARPQLEIAWDGADVERSLAMRLLSKQATLVVVDRAGQRHTALKASEQLPLGRVSVLEVNLSTGGNFSDEDLQQLALLPELQRLSLAGVQVGPDALRRMHGLTTLKSLDLGTPRLAPSSVAALRTALPACEVLVREPTDVEVARLVCQAGGKVNLFTERNQLLADLGDVKDLPQSGYTVRAVTLDGVATPDAELLAKIVELSGLSQLFLSNTPVTDEFVLKLAACKALEELTLSGTRISGNAIASLRQLPKLSRLYLAKTEIGGEGVRQLGACPQLTHLSLLGVQLADDDLTPLKRLEKLEWLDVSQTPLSDGAVAHLAQLKKLREVNITGCEITDAGQEELAALLAKRCRVVASPLSRERLAARWFVEHSATVGLESGRLTSIKNLPRRHCRVLSVDLEGLAQLKRSEIGPQLAACPNLVALNLSKTSLEADLAFLRSMPDLRELHLANVSISDQALLFLKDHAALEVLDLGGTRLSGTGLRQLAKATELKELLLANAPVDERHLSAISQFPKLEVLDLSAAGMVTDSGATEISKLTNLRTLRLRRAKITDAALEKFAGLTELTQLELEGTKIGDAGVAKLASLTKLRQLGLANTQVTDGVAGTLGSMKQLRSINLARTTVSAETIRQLQAELPGCSITAPALVPRDSPPGTSALEAGGAAGNGTFRAGRIP